MSTPAEIAAYVGAAAWLPPILLLIYRAIVKPKVTIVPEKQVEIGYTVFGPIFNLRLAVSVEQKGTVIDYVGVSIQHEDGSIHEFAWEGMKETFSEIKDLSGNMQFVEREYSPIAIVLHRNEVTERFFRFQVPSFHSKHKELLRAVSDHKAYLKNKSTEYHKELLDSKQVHDIIEFYNQYFFWKAGFYNVRFTVESPSKVILVQSTYKFELKSYEVDDLRGNLPMFKVDTSNHINKEIEGFKPEEINWKWVSTALERI